MTYRGVKVIATPAAPQYGAWMQAVNGPTHGSAPTRE